jgi:hypothetical protein
MMKLLSTIQKIIRESEEAYTLALERFEDEKTLTQLEKKYQESLKLMEMYNRMNKKKKINLPKL